jgi:Uma2 family endonuclease
MAAMKAVDPRVSYVELEQWPDDGRRYELYGGEVIVVPAPVPIHQIVVHRISEILDAYAQQTGGLMLFSPIDIVFSEYDVLQPDVVFFTTLRRRQIDLRSAIRVVPDLVGEVLSRSTAARDRGRKLELFERYGVPEYWILDPIARTLELLANAGGRFQTIGAYDEAATITSPTLPDLQFATADLFRV